MRVGVVKVVVMAVEREAVEMEEVGTVVEVKAVAMAMVTAEV